MTPKNVIDCNQNYRFDASLYYHEMTNFALKNTNMHQRMMCIKSELYHLVRCQMHHFNQCNNDN